jgi:DNA-nicking Smr family endonuclease
MSFGDILDKWEKSQPRKPKNNAMETWLENNEVYDKDADAQKKSAPDRARLRNARPDDILDIHGLTKDEAWISLDRFFSNAKENGFKKLRVIHGKGNHSQKEAVLKNTVREYIEKCPFAGESAHEKASAGGSGATWVLLKA